VHGCSKIVEHLLLSEAVKASDFRSFALKRGPGVTSIDIYAALNENIPEAKMVVDSAIGKNRQYLIGNKPFEIPFTKRKENLSKFQDLKVTFKRLNVWNLQCY